MEKMFWITGDSNVPSPLPIATSSSNVRAAAVYGDNVEFAVAVEVAHHGRLIGEMEPLTSLFTTKVEGSGKRTG